MRMDIGTLACNWSRSYSCDLDMSRIRIHGRTVWWSSYSHGHLVSMAARFQVFSVSLDRD